MRPMRCCSRALKRACSSGRASMEWAPLRPHQLQALEDVPGLGFNHKDDRVVAYPAVGPDEHKEVGKSSDGNAAKGLRTGLPSLVERNAVTATEEHWGKKVGGAEAGTED